MGSAHRPCAWLRILRSLELESCTIVGQRIAALIEREKPAPRRRTRGPRRSGRRGRRQRLGVLVNAVGGAWDDVVPSCLDERVRRQAHDDEPADRRLAGS